jgi:hypothetical protein
MKKKMTKLQKELTAESRELELQILYKSKQRKIGDIVKYIPPFSFTRRTILTGKIISIIPHPVKGIGGVAYMVEDLSHPGSRTNGITEADIVAGVSL